MYAIIDLESTGGKYGEEGITEIAIYVFNGEEVVSEFCSLVNPEQSIQSYVSKLTGITDAMVAKAPKFFEIADKVLSITEGCIFVAHNASFDYRMLQTEFNRLGQVFSRKTICTVELAQQLFPSQESYSLGKLVRNLGISISDRHRAKGDALATLKLFKLLLDNDLDCAAVTEKTRTHTSKVLEKRLLSLVDQAPIATGIYFIKNENTETIYIGKSKNLKKRLTQQFGSTKKKSKLLQAEVQSVHYEITGSELLAQLKENEQIRLKTPKYNRAARKRLFHQALYEHTNAQGYRCLEIQKAQLKNRHITSFTNAMQASKYMRKWMESYKLCKELLRFDSLNGTCFHAQAAQCNLSCSRIESPKTYNQRVQKLVTDQSLQFQNVMIVENIQKSAKQALVLIEKAKLKGIGYTEDIALLRDKEKIYNSIDAISHNVDAIHLIHNYLRKYYHRLKILPLPYD